MRRPKKLFDIVSCMRNVLDIPLTCKMRTGVESRKNTAHEIIPKLRDLGVDLVTVSDLTLNPYQSRDLLL